MLHSIDGSRQNFVRELRRLITDQSEDRAAVAGVLAEHPWAVENIEIIADLLSLGELHKLHPILAPFRRRVEGTPMDKGAKAHAKALRDALLHLQKEARVYAEDYELKELSYVLFLLYRSLSIAPSRLTLMPDGTRQPMTALFHQSVMAGAAPLLATAATVVLPERDAA